MLGDRWGVHPDETHRRYGCDEVIASPTLEAWRGIMVAAPAHDVWPWIRQLRVAPYSYDWLDNLGRRSPRVLSDLTDWQVGDPFTSAGGRPVGRVVAIDPGREVTATIAGTAMSYRIVRGDMRWSQLLLKIVGRMPRPMAQAVCLGDLVMARRQLMNLKELAENR